ncbi:MAG: acetyl-CoA carboxylase biotin carboxyl carrier protein [Phycisphaerae bacterium]
MLDVDKIRQLVEMMVDNDLVEISLRDGEQEVNLRRPNANMAIAMPQLETVVSPEVERQPAAAPAAQEAAPAPAPAPADDSELVEITSPMVGTFYAGSDPDAPPYITIGDVVHPGSVLCILEAMKVFNEIKAELSGKIERILVKNSEAVEYGQPLFMLRPM